MYQRQQEKGYLLSQWAACPIVLILVVIEIVGARYFVMHVPVKGPYTTTLSTNRMKNILMQKPLQKLSIEYRNWNGQ